MFERFGRIGGFFLFTACFLPSSALSDFIGHGGMVRTVDFSGDGQRIVTASFDYSAIIWNFEDQKEISVLDGHEGPVTSARFLSDGRVLTTGDDKMAMIWEISGTTARVQHRLAGHSHKVMTAGAYDGGRRVVTGGWDKSVRIWDSRTGMELRRIDLPVPVNALAVVDGGAAVAVGGHDNLIRLFDLSTGRALGKLQGHKMGITGLRVAPDGKRLLSSSIDKTLRLWDVNEQQSIRVFERHDSQIYGVRFTPDGRHAVSGGRDGYLVMWDVATGKLRKAIRAHDKTVWAVAVSPDGRFAVTGSSDETARIWHLETGDRIGAAAAEGAEEPKPWMASSHPGAAMYRKCARCHSLGPGSVRRSGPHFQGLFGRRVGAVAGYRYSDALKSKDFVWDRNTLFRLFDEGPDRFLPGTKMPVQRVPDREKLSHLVDYLEQLTAPSQ